jgi:tetratricopeptide (TPR) repeat protein
MRDVRPLKTATAARWSAVLLAIALCAAPEAIFAQHAAFRIKGRVKTDAGDPVAGATVRAEAFFGYAAGTFAGQRVFTVDTNAKGDWSIGALQPGVWMFTVTSADYLPEIVVLPPRLLATVSQGTSGLSLPWDLILKPLKVPDSDRGKVLTAAAKAAQDGHADDARSALQSTPETADADFLAAAGRIALVANDPALASTLFQKAIGIDPSSYRATLGLASTFLLQRDFDSASRAFDAARNRTHDKDEQRFISAALGELANIKVR